MNKKHLKAVPDKPVMDDKINTPTDINKFGGGKKVDKKTLKRMNKPENQFNSYNPLDEERYKRPKELKNFDQFVKDAAGKEGRERIDGMNKAIILLLGTTGVVLSGIVATIFSIGKKSRKVGE